jgi:excisionase family DNA binding protein
LRGGGTEHADKAYYTLDEVAERLGIGRTTVYQEVVEVNLKAKRFGKKNIRIPAEELKRYEEEQDYYKGTYR